jgi:hypothetical protein
MFHCEKLVWGQVELSPLNCPTIDATSGSSDHGGNMHPMLRDLFGIHDIREDNSEP